MELTFFPTGRSASLGYPLAEGKTVTGPPPMFEVLANDKLINTIGIEELKLLLCMNEGCGQLHFTFPHRMQASPLECLCHWFYATNQPYSESIFIHTYTGYLKLIT
jgi:hypothetical protein